MCLKKNNKKITFFFSWHPYYLPSLVMNVPFIKHRCTTFTQRRRMIMICALSDYYQGDILEVFFFFFLTKWEI